MGEITVLLCGRAVGCEIAGIGKPTLVFAAARGFNMDAGPEPFSGNSGSCLIVPDGWRRLTPKKMGP